MTTTISHIILVVAVNLVFIAIYVYVHYFKAHKDIQITIRIYEEFLMCVPEILLTEICLILISLILYRNLQILHRILFPLFISYGILDISILLRRLL